MKLELDGDVVSVNQLYKDHDGLFFLGYLNFPKDENVQLLAGKSMHWVTDRIKEENNIRILQKLGWHKNYLESILRE